MPELGFALSSEEHGPNDLVHLAARAEETGFGFALVSDHFHPWLPAQGEAPFVWTTLGGIAQSTDELQVGTGVTCPTLRIHPANVAQAAATAGVMFDGRFFLGVGTGERLNEHVTGRRWPPHHVRLEMIEEAVTVIRELWTGDQYSHDGEYYTVENARLFTRPDEPPPIAVAAGGPQTATMAGRVGDALVSTTPSSRLADAFADEAPHGAPRYGQVAVCWDESRSKGREIVHEWWSNSALPGELGQELATPAQFEQAVELVTEEDAVEHVPCGPDAAEHIAAIQAFVDAGFDHIYVHQIGPKQGPFMEFFEAEVQPSFE